MTSLKCKICRRLGVKLFLKGDRCLSPKCPMIRRPYPPGQKGKRRTGTLSEYGKELREKQKLKNWYNLRERQFKKYVKETLSKQGKIEDTAALLIIKLETRLDNVVFRLGLAPSRAKARQLVNHGHFLVNNKVIDIPAYQVKKGDKIKISERTKKKKVFQNLEISLKKYQPPSWLEFNIKNLEGQVKALPSIEEAAPPAEISAIFEYYSR
ncbi:30S ribosomal protein S4 [Patescibacteria group bacterium]